MSDQMASKLCAACGLCCDGTLYPSFESEEGDALDHFDERLRQVAQKGAKVTWSQPCSALKDGACLIYHDRPVVCRRYQCTTLEALANGRLSLEQAQKHIEQAKDAKEKLGELIGLNGTSSANRLRVLRNTATDPEIQLAIGVLELVLDRHFRKTGERAFGSDLGSFPMNADAD
jgi:uncharacterized protein